MLVVARSDNAVSAASRLRRRGASLVTCLHSERGSFPRVGHLRSLTHYSLSRPSCRLFCILPRLGNTIDVDPEGSLADRSGQPFRPSFSCSACLRKPKKARRFIILRLLKGFAGIAVKRGFVFPVQRYSCSDINFSVDAFAGRFRRIHKSPRIFGLLECGTTPKNREAEFASAC